MVDRSISRQHRWKVKGRLAVLEYAAQHGVRPARIGERMGLVCWGVMPSGMLRHPVLRAGR